MLRGQRPERLGLVALHHPDQLPRPGEVGELPDRATGTGRDRLVIQVSEGKPEDLEDVELVAAGVTADPGATTAVPDPRLHVLHRQRRVPVVVGGTTGRVVSAPFLDLATVSA